MKTIQTFLLGKLRRAEVEDAVRLEVEGPDHPTLGRLEGRLQSDRGELGFYAEGIDVPGLYAVPYADVVRAALDPDVVGVLELSLADGRRVRLTGTREGIEVVFAALRWIGHTILRRPLT